MGGTLTNAAGDTITLTAADKTYTDNIDGYDISAYDYNTITLYNRIKSAEYTGANYGKGLFLVSNEKAESTTLASQGSGNYWTALKTAADNYSSFGASGADAWLGTYEHSFYAWCVNRDGSTFSGAQNYSFVLAPAFNLDTSKITLEGNAITVNAE